MSKGRRAADRRRERGGGDDGDDGEDVTRASLDEATRNEASPRRGPRSRKVVEDETRVTLDEITDQTAAPKRRRRNEDVPSIDGDLSRAISGPGPAETTQPGVERPERPPVGGALRDLAEPKGRPIPLAVSPTVLGRGAACALQLDDETVSRAHCQLTFVEEDGMWVLEDLGSSSGTLLNGELLGMPASVRHGDLIHLGRTALRFQWSETVPEHVVEHTATAATRLTRHGKEPTKVGPGLPADDGGEKKSKAPLVAALIALALLLVGGGVGTAIVLWSGQGAKQDQIAEQIESLLSEGKAFLQQRRFDDARARVETIFALQEGHLGAKSLLRSIESEEEARDHLQQAKALLEKGDLEGARLELKKIPDSSLFAKDRDAVLEQMIEADKGAELAAIQALLDAGDLEAAAERLERFLKHYPDDPAAQKLKKRQAALASYKPPENAAVVRAKKAFAVGNPEQARIIASEEASKGNGEAKAYLDRLGRFEQLYSRGKKALAKKKGAEAEDALDGAYDLADDLSGQKSGQMRREVAGELADALYLVGVQHQQRGQTCEGARALLRAAALDPEDSKVSAAKRKLDRDAEAALSRAEARRSSSPDEARRIAGENACLASASSKTGKRLRALAR